MTKEEELYQELIDNMGVIGAPKYEDLPPDDSVRKVIEQRAADESEE